MNVIEEKIYKMKPGYLSRFDPLVKEFAQFGGGAEKDKYISGRGFSSAYEFYTFAFFIGLYTNSPMDLSPNDKLSVFMEVEHWKPRELVDQLLACSLAESSFDMLGAEQLDETAVTKEIRKLRGTIEAYSNGGFELIEKTISDNPDEVLNDDFFVKLLIR